MASDRELVGAWRDGDDVAGRALFERYFSPLRRFFHGKVDGPIEDLIQLTLTACLEGAQKLRDDAAFRPYLFAIARHQLFAHYRRTHRDWARMQTQDTSVADLAPSPSALLASDQDTRALLGALRSIPIDLQVLLELYYWEGMPTAELAEVLEAPKSTITTRLARARALLREQLAEGGATELSAGSLHDLESWVRRVRADPS